MEENNLPEGIITEEPVLTFEEFCVVSGVDEQYIIEMISMGILEPEGTNTSNWHFSLLHLWRFRRAERLKNDLKLNLAGVALSLDLLDELKELRSRIKNLQHQINLLTQ